MTLQLLIVPAADTTVAKKAAEGNIYAQLSSCLGVQRLSCCKSSLILREEHRLRVFENRVLRRILGSDRKELTRNCRKLHAYEPHDLSSTWNIIRMIKSRRMRWAGMWNAWWREEEKRGEEKRGEVYTAVGWGLLKNRDHLENAGVDRMVILKWVSRK